MGSKKVLSIILIVGFAIFIVSWAIGRPMWQALIFSIGFLLIAAVVTSRGLLIPERLLGKGRHEESTEVTGKESFHKKMDLMLADLSTQPGATTEDAKWMTEYTQVMKEVSELVYAVHESVRSRDRVKELRAFRAVAKELPRLISQFEDMPELTIPERREAIEQQRQGLDLYLEACSDFTEALETSDGKLAGQAAMQINEALTLLDLMDKSQLM